VNLNYATLPLVLLVLFTSCKESTANTAGEPTAVTVSNDIPVVIEDFRFKIKTHNEQEVPGDMPTHDIYLYTWERADSVFVATEVASLNMNDIDSRHLFDMPKDCAIAINCYFAGAGNVYYGVAIENQLAMYKGVAQGEKMVYTPYKTYSFFENRIDTQDFSIKR